MSRDNPQPGEIPEMISMQAIRDLREGDVLIIRVPAQYCTPGLSEGLRRVVAHMRAEEPISNPPIILLLPDEAEVRRMPAVPPGGGLLLWCPPGHEGKADAASSAMRQAAREQGRPLPVWTLDPPPGDKPGAWALDAPPAPPKDAPLMELLREALEGWEYAAQYKGAHLMEKHNDAARIAAIRAMLPAYQPPAPSSLAESRLPLVCAVCGESQWVEVRSYQIEGSSPPYQQTPLRLVCADCGASHSDAQEAFRKALNSPEVQDLRWSMSTLRGADFDAVCAHWGVQSTGSTGLRVEQVCAAMARILVLAAAPQAPEAPPALPPQDFGSRK